MCCTVRHKQVCIHGEPRAFDTPFIEFVVDRRMNDI